MTYDWDEAKNRANKTKHGLGFELMMQFNWGSAVIDVDDRHYGELREIADGFVGITLYHVVFTRRGEVIRVISLRKSTKKEIIAYAQKL